MATKEQYIACFGEEIVILEDKKIVDRIILDDQVIFNSIDKVIEEGVKAPTLIFKTAIEKIMGMKFVNPRRVFKIGEKELSIHDQEIYRKKFYPYIVNNQEMKRQLKYVEEQKKAKKKYNEENRQIELFRYREHQKAIRNYKKKNR